MPQIGSQYVTSIDRDVAKNFGTIPVEVTRPFVDGHAFLDGRKKATPNQFSTLAYVTSEANAKTLKEAYDAMRGTIVTIVHKGTFPNMLILDVGDYNTQQIATSVGMLNSSTGATIAAGTAGYVVSATWLVIYKGLT